MADINSAPGSESWNTAMAAKIARADANAVLDTSGPLPKSAHTLVYIPEDRRACYARAMDGSFKLRFIHSDDEASMTAYQDEIAAAQLLVYEPGDTPELRAQRHRDAEARAQAVLDQVDAEEARAKEAKRQAAYNAGQAKLKKQYGF